ncbi:hypothetical protein SAMN02745163_03464 [Clostridium cavendishii DSM 21758]|uniref:Uncharacterized protein n=1 Tax=Clostridium cavendishii DSM 21758 TaxID=1121302 RepID=A0A1M6QVD1_9CLOT|nr:hypothetical protein [Clostridium cavendishii]SHK24073.1 hypothetical protein SAMN02745163_03464 [Clostridium cavendishii DSM 21758]
MKKHIIKILVGITISTSLISIGNGAFVNADIKGDNWYIQCASDSTETKIPKLLSGKQLSANQLEITYDKDVDPALATKASNYWIQSTKQDKPEGIATLGKDEKVSDKNSLTDKMVKIVPKDGSSKTFILTFKDKIKTGQEYKLIICYVTVKGAPPYKGDNGKALFVGKY